MAALESKGKRLSSGIDVVSIERLAVAAAKKGFVDRIFTASEIEFSFAKKEPYRHLAGRFAAKEACKKALSSDFAGPIGWKEVEVLTGEDGRPVVRFHRRAGEFLGKRRAFLSIAYGKKTAAALVILE
jgi:holo-[acyl-carrier protein] synthase